MRRPANLLIGLILGVILPGNVAAEATSSEEACRVVADGRVEEPLGAMVAEYMRHTNRSVHVDFREADGLNSRIGARQRIGDLVVCMAEVT